jgi:hypothetical protein
MVTVLDDEDGVLLGVTELPWVRLTEGMDAIFQISHAPRNVTTCI